MNKDKFINVIEQWANIISENKDYLTELDQPIGDSDHGINLNRGFQAVIAKLPEIKDKDLGTIVKTIGTTLVSTVGGASGPLYGTFFMKAASPFNGKDEGTIEEFKEAFNAGIEGVKMRGKADLGAATMLDAMIPAYNVLCEKLTAGEDAKNAFLESYKACEEGCKKTIDMVATKGRAAYLGERGIGHQDPGATSFTLLYKVLSENV